MNYSVLFSSVASVILLTAGCGLQNPDSPDGKYSRRTGDPVVFSVGAHDDAPTRTQYRDEDVSGGFQHIDWLQGDKLRIYCPQTPLRYDSDIHWADYTVTPVPGTPELGTLDNALPNGLVWGETGIEYRFYSVYPSPEGTDPHAGLSGTFHLTMPAAQTVPGLMDNAFMTAAASVTTGGSDAEAVKLDFYPAFTAFEFQLVGEEEEVTLNSITLSSTSTPLTGSFTVTYDGTSASYSCSGTGMSATLTLPAGTVLSRARPVTCTLLTMPGAATDLKLTLVRTYKGTAVTNSLALNYANGTPLAFNPLKKYVLKGLVTPVILQVTTFDVTTGSWQTWTHGDTVLSN
jgi:hypothetical protein